MTELSVFTIFTLFPFAASYSHSYCIGPVPFSTLHIIEMLDPSSGETSVTSRLGTETAAVRQGGVISFWTYSFADRWI